MSVNLSGWTKVGDRIDPNGRWTVYKYGGREFDSVELLESFPDADAEKASDLYKKQSEKIKRGGVWLVTPAGIVTSLHFIRFR